MDEGIPTEELQRVGATALDTEPPDDALPFVNYATIASPAEGDQWLIEDVWPKDGVGILGGSSKLGKSLLTIEMAVSVASGQPFLGLYPVNGPGLVMICSMEGQRWLAPDRLRKVARYRVGSGTGDLQIEVLDNARLQLDDATDLRRLTATVERRRPRLLILDPLVRLHSRDENAAIGGVSSVLADLTALQRGCGVSILAAHHNRKQQRSGERPGMGLRGSSDLHAWGDSNWFLRDRGAGAVTLTVEHRAAASPEPLRLRLVGDDDELHFEVLGEEPAPGQERPTVESIADRVITVLEREAIGLGFGPLRDEIGVSAPAVMAAIRTLEVSGKLHLVSRRWCLRSVPPAPPTTDAERTGTEQPEAVESRTKNA